VHHTLFEFAKYQRQNILIRNGGREGNFSKPVQETSRRDWERAGATPIGR